MSPAKYLMINMNINEITKANKAEARIIYQEFLTSVKYFSSSEVLKILLKFVFFTKFISDGKHILFQ